MKMIKEYENGDFSILEAFILGIFFSFLGMWTNRIDALPLFDFWVDAFQGPIFATLLLIATILVFYRRKYLTSLYWICFACILIVTVYKYSSGYAFRSFVLFILLFGILFKERSEREKVVVGILILSLVYILAAIHKMNGVYFSGVEYLSGNPLVSFLETWFPKSAPTVFPTEFKYVPHISVLIEFLIGVGILIYPRVCVHVAALFLIVIAYVNPPVFNVYYFFLPFIIVIDLDFYKKLLETSCRSFLVTPFFWSFYIFFSTYSLFKFESALERSYLFVTIALVIHIFAFIRTYKEQDKFSRLTLKEVTDKRILIIPSIMILLFIGSFYFIPGPFGFKMFSGKRFGTGSYVLKMYNKEVCEYTRNTWIFSSSTDSQIIINENDCHIKFPSRGGLVYATRKICEKFIDAELVLNSPEAVTDNQINCAEYRN